MREANPDLIFIEKDASFRVLDLLIADGRTVVMNTEPALLRMIARATQTIICPNSNFISKAFKIGQCGQFRVQQQKGFSGTEVYTTQQTSMLYLEGTQKELGCSIVLKGSD